MSYETLKNIVSSVPNDSIYSFDISAIGETLSFNRLPEFISYMKGKKPKVNTIISTNALLLTEKKMQQLIESKLDNIQLSLYAHSKADYKWLTGRDSFEKVKNNVIKASELRQNMGLDKPYLQAFMMGAKEFDGIYDDFISFWNNYVDHAFIRPLYNVGKKDLNGLTPTFKKMPKRYPCVMPWYSTAIRSNGDVLACYNFHWYDKKHKIGNINKNSLTEIWNNNIINKFREDHLKLNIDKYNACKECVLWDAYTNIWDKSGKNYTYQLRTKDLFNSVNDYRGG
jgi:radical SAM protein with 4Fe4S-binding SPASM domain